MKRITATIILALTLAGCSLSPTGVAITTANSVRAVAETEQQMILDYCVPRYVASTTLEEVKATDAICQPAKASYLAVNAAWNGLKLVIQESKAGKASDKNLENSAAELAKALVQLEKTIEVIRGK